MFEDEGDGAAGQERDQFLYQEPDDGHAEGCESPLPHRLSSHGRWHVFQVLTAATRTKTDHTLFYIFMPLFEVGIAGAILENRPPSPPPFPAEGWVMSTETRNVWGKKNIK